MKYRMGSSIFQLLLSFILVTTFLQEPTLATKKSYVVYLGGHSHGPNPSPADVESATNYHYDLLSSVLGSHEKAKEAIMYSFNKHINGFTALLEEEEAAEIEKNSNVVSVFRTREHKLHTTRSWDFLDLVKNEIVPENSAWSKGSFGQDTIIANIDTGVWPEHPSFSDEGMGPVPSRWRRDKRDIHCEINQLNGSKKVPCNRKLIGARVFCQNYEAIGQVLKPEYRSARDFVGHGTHTLAIAGGSFVPGANLGGNGNGTSKGGSPRARVVAYKACCNLTDATGCYDGDIMSAFEQAISDGVDVISVSLGADLPYPEAMFTDGISIGSFHAVAKGIAVVNSAGNYGPDPASVANVSPWQFTVAASTIDREFVSNISLGNNTYMKGDSVSKGLEHHKFYPLINAADAKLQNVRREDARHCKTKTLDPKKVNGTFLMCRPNWRIKPVTMGVEALRAGAVGMLVIINDKDTGNRTVAENQPLPACSVSCHQNSNCVNRQHGSEIYMTNARTDLGTKPAPIIPYFSSRGPSTIMPLILKPDVTAPGVEIISAFSLGTSPSNQPTDKRQPVPFNVLSGTSMSCPHVAGIVGLLKTLHPDWSPAAIKSAIMTTATTINKTDGLILDHVGREATPLDYGTGLIQPNFAMDPGLVYNLSIADYFNLCCAINCANHLRNINYGKPYTCPDPIPKVEDFNYPSITVGYLPIFVTRTVTNVGPPSTYHVSTHVRNESLMIQVWPNYLTFRKTGEKKTFYVALDQQPSENEDLSDGNLFGDISWTDGNHTVTSPIVVLANYNGTAFK